MVVGLGNPAPKYDGTRHNVGFVVLDELARRRGLTFESSPVDAVTARERGTADPLMLVKPLTFMNRSGDAVGGLARYFRVEPEDVLVVVDDVNLPLGRLRARPGGSAGGHNGLKSVIAGLGTQGFPRLRLGVGRGDERWDLADHVLARFDAAERGDVDEMVIRAIEAVAAFQTDGIAAVMNRYNAALAPESDAETS